MDDNLQRYLPEYDDEEMNAKLFGFNAEELKQMLIRCYREKRVIAKMLDEQYKKLEQIREALDQPSKLLAMPDVPGPDEIRKMME